MFGAGFAIRSVAGSIKLVLLASAVIAVMGYLAMTNRQAERAGANGAELRHAIETSRANEAGWKREREVRKATDERYAEIDKLAQKVETKLSEAEEANKELRKLLAELEKRDTGCYPDSKIIWPSG